MKTRFLPETAVFENGKHRLRLGRHVEHDPRSRDYPFKIAAKVNLDNLVPVIHRHYGKVLDQGELGSCTGNAIAQACNTIPLHHYQTRLLVEKDAVNIYSKATAIDEWDGQYPPDDTGSSGLAVCKIAQSLNLIKEYRHTFTLEEALSALQDQPVITGIPWFEGMFYPNDDGVVTISGQLAGGHEIVAIGFHIPRYAKTVKDVIVEYINSWSKLWGHRGRFYMTAGDWWELLEQDGDVTVPIATA